MKIKKMIRSLLNILPPKLVSLLEFLRFYLKTPKQVHARDDYYLSDGRIKFIHLLEAMNYVRTTAPMGIPETFFEFGCHSGRTFSAAVNASKYLNMKSTKFYAFDSFQGLPQTKIEEDGIFKTGSFFTSEVDFKKIIKKKTNLILEQKYIIKGFYSKSLTKELQSKMPKVGVVHIDVDLYTSAIEVLEFIKPLMVVGTVLLFDDWYCFPPGSNKGEVKAVNEFMKAHPSFKIEEWKAYSTFGKSFFVTALP